MLIDHFGPIVHIFQSIKLITIHLVIAWAYLYLILPKCSFNICFLFCLPILEAYDI